MKIQVIGDNSPATALRGHLQSLGYDLANFGADYSIHLSEDALSQIKILGGEGPFLAEALGKVKELATVPVEARASGSDTNNLHVRFGSNAGTAVELGVLRALLNLTRHGSAPASAATVEPTPHASWLKKIFG
jgi:hypothetical protein